MESRSFAERHQQPSDDNDLIFSQEIDYDETAQKYLKDLDELAKKYQLNSTKPISVKKFKEIINEYYGDKNDIHIYKSNKDNQNIFHYLIYAEFDNEFILLFEDLCKRQIKTNLANNQLLHKSSHSITPLERALIHGKLHYAILISEKLLSDFTVDSFQYIITRAYPESQKNFQCNNDHCKRLNYFALCWLLDNFTKYKSEDRDRLTDWIIKLINDDMILYDNFEVFKAIEERRAKIEEEKKTKNDVSFFNKKLRSKYLLPLLHRVLLLANFDISRCQRILKEVDKNLRRLNKETVEENKDTALLSFVYHIRNLDAIKILLPQLTKLFDPLIANHHRENLINKAFRRSDLKFVTEILDVIFTSLPKDKIDKLLLSNTTNDPLAYLLLEKPNTPSKKTSGEAINLSRLNSGMEEKQQTPSKKTSGEAIDLSRSNSDMEEKQPINYSQVIAITRRIIDICPEICYSPIGDNGDSLLMIAIKNRELNKLIQEIAIIAKAKDLSLEKLLDHRNSGGSTPMKLANSYGFDLIRIMNDVTLEQACRYYIPREEYEELCNKLKEAKTQLDRYLKESKRLREERDQARKELNELKNISRQTPEFLASNTDKSSKKRSPESSTEDNDSSSEENLRSSPKCKSRLEFEDKPVKKQKLSAPPVNNEMEISEATKTAQEQPGDLVIDEEDFKELEDGEIEEGENLSQNDFDQPEEEGDKSTKEKTHYSEEEGAGPIEPETNDMGGDEELNLMYFEGLEEIDDKKSYNPEEESNDLIELEKDDKAEEKNPSQNDFDQSEEEDDKSIKGKTYASAEELLGDTTDDLEADEHSTNVQFSLNSKNNSWSMNDTNKTGDKGEAYVLNMIRARHSERFDFVSPIKANRGESPYFFANKPKPNYHVDEEKNQKNISIQDKKVEWFSKVIKDNGKLGARKPASTHDIRITTNFSKQEVPKERNVEVKATTSNKFDFWLSPNQMEAVSQENAYFLVNNVGKESEEECVKLKNATLQLERNAIQIKASVKKVTSQYENDSLEEPTTIGMASIKFKPEFNF